MLDHLRHLASTVVHGVRAPHETWFVLKHPDLPWLYGEAQQASRAAEAASHALVRSDRYVDDEGDAVRHAFAAARFVLGMERDHHLGRDRAVRLAVEAGDAHEADGRDAGEGAQSASMDRHNNAVGARLVGSGRDAAGDWLSDAQLRRKVVAALRHGTLTRVDGDHVAPTDGHQLR